MTGNPVLQETTGTRPSLRGLLLYFLRLGALGFGGPIALVGYMQRDLVEERKWVSKEDYFEGLAFSQVCRWPRSLPSTSAGCTAALLARRSLERLSFFRRFSWF